jgi:DNA polymerase-3 subunit epsilon
MTIFNKKTRKEVEELPFERLENVLKMQEELQGKKFRCQEDNFISLAKYTKPLSEVGKKVQLKDLLKDWHSIPKEDRARYFMVFDTETTDYSGYIVSIACILYDIQENKILDSMYTLVNPQTEISAGAQKVHKISQEDVKDAPSFIEIWPEIKKYYDQQCNIVGHNIGFDLRVIERELDRANFPELPPVKVFDTMELAKDVLKLKDKNGRRIKAPSLEECINYYAIQLPSEEYHNALVDTEASLEVFKKLMSEEV